MTGFPLGVSMRFENESLLWTVKDLYSESECQQLIRVIQNSNPQPATNNLSFRNQDRVIRDDLIFARELFQRLRQYLPERMANFKLIGINPRLRMYRYRSQQSFSPHMDHWYQPKPNQITLHTILLYLNDNFVGGETRFMEQIERTIIPQTGMVAIFQHKIRHEGCKVIRGTKYAVRTDVIYEKI